MSDCDCSTRRRLNNCSTTRRSRRSRQCGCPPVGKRSTKRRSQSCQCSVWLPSRGRGERSFARGWETPRLSGLPSRGRGERSTRRPAGWSARPRRVQRPAAPSLHCGCPTVGVASVPSPGDGRGRSVRWRSIARSSRRSASGGAQPCFSELLSRRKALIQRGMYHCSSHTHTVRTQ